MPETLPSYGYLTTGGLAFTVVAVALAYWRLRKTAPDTAFRQWLPWALAAKLSAGAGVGLAYAWIYGGAGDSMALFHDATFVNSLLESDFSRWREYMSSPAIDEAYFEDRLHAGLNPRAIWAVRGLSLLLLATGGSFWLAGALLSLLSFWGQWFLATRLARWFPGTGKAALLALFALPTALFWSAGVLKESVLLACVGWAVGHALDMAYGRLSLRQWAFKGSALALCGLFMLLVKYYYLGALFPALLGLVLAERSGLRLGMKAAVFAGVYGGLAFAATFAHPNLRPSALLQAVALNNERMAQQTIHKGSLIRYPFPTDGSLTHALLNSPSAMGQALFRPYLWEARHWGQAAASLERLGLALLFGFALSKRPFRNAKRNALPLLAVAAYCLPLWALLSLAAPNLGNLVRYEAGFLPFLAYIAWSVILRERT